MATTTNFGWETPDDTDLVKDGALAMRTLGNAIDASLVDLKGGTTGQVLSKNSNTDMDFTWVTSDDADAIQNSIVDAKGDLIAATADNTPARLAVGNSGEIILADSSTTTGLRWQADWNTGKNKLINSDFNIWQRGTSFNTNAVYTADRWKIGFGGSGTAMTTTREAFTAGSAPVAGYESEYFIRSAVTGGSGNSSLAVIQQPVEDVRTLAGQTVTLSFWAKASSGTPSIGVDLFQEFGSTGSPSGTVSNGGTKVAITTSWARYSVTISLASIAGKTITLNSLLGVRLWFSSGSDYNSLNGSLGIQSNTFDIWGVQLEAGSVATPFTTATGTLAGELAACQRYYCRYSAEGDAYQPYVIGYAYSTTKITALLKFPITMRTSPSTALGFGGNFQANADGATLIAVTNISNVRNSKDYAQLDFTASGLTQYRPYTVQSDNSTATFLAFSAEL